jgi:uncharacterized membrane protein
MWVSSEIIIVMDRQMTEHDKQFGVRRNGRYQKLSYREKTILTIIQNYPGIKSGEIAEKLAIPSPTVKRILSDLQNKGMIDKYGKGRGTVYLSKYQ